MSLKQKKSNKKPKDHSKSNKKVQFTNELVLLDCVKAKDVENVRYLLTTLQTSNSIDINMLNESTGLSLLHHAVLEDSIDLVKLLLQSNADINCLDEDSWTPLHISASMGYYELTKLLLDNGADINLRTFDQLKPIDLIEGDKYELKSLFEKYSTKPFVSNIANSSHAGLFSSSTSSSSPVLMNKLNSKSNESLFVSCK